jgi:hypothetical protein
MRLRRNRLRRELRSQAVVGKPFRLGDASVGEKGLQSDLQLADWEPIRDLAYQGRA